MGPLLDTFCLLYIAYLSAHWHVEAKTKKKSLFLNKFGNVHKDANYLLCTQFSINFMIIMELQMPITSPCYTVGPHHHDYSR